MECPSRCEGVGDFVFERDGVDRQCSLNMNCTVALSDRVKKCHDSNGEWRIGTQVNSAMLSDGTLCGTINVSGFPWYSKDATVAGHCPFLDDCDSFIPYDPCAISYTGNFGRSVLRPWAWPSWTASTSMTWYSPLVLALIFLSPQIFTIAMETRIVP